MQAKFALLLVLVGLLACVMDSSAQQKTTRGTTRLPTTKPKVTTRRPSSAMPTTATRKDMVTTATATTSRLSSPLTTSGTMNTAKTTVPRPTPLTPQPLDNFYYVSEPGNICILMKFSATFQITYNDAFSMRRTVTVPFVAAGAVANGTCGRSSRQSIVLYWTPVGQLSVYPPWTLTFNLVTVGALADSYTIEMITMRYLLSPGVFPNVLPFDAGRWVTISIASTSLQNRFKTPSRGAFRCNAEERVLINDVQMNMRNFKIEAFRMSPRKAFSTNEAVCSEDRPPGKFSLVGVIIVAVLVVLAAVAAAAYLFHRRRHLAYQQFR